MMPTLFTIVCEFDGGTYVSQVEACDQVEAVRAWADKLSLEKPIPRVTNHVVRNVLRDLDDELGLVALDGLKGVWCFDTLIGGKIVLGKVIASA